MISTLSYEKILAVCKDTLLINYWCIRKDSIYASDEYLVGLKEINRWIEYFNQYDNYDICLIGYNREKKKVKLIKNELELDPLVAEILMIGNGKISLCGGAIISLLSKSRLNDYDLFFHGISIEEADDLLEQCLNHIINSSRQDITYSRSRFVITIYSADFKIQFIKRIYQTKEQVLFGFDLAACRFGYNTKDGLFATICGGLSFAMKAFPLDLTKYGTSYRHRLNKYSVDKGYKVLLIGLPSSFNEEKVTFDNITLGAYDIIEEEQEPARCYIIHKINDDNEIDYHGNEIVNCSLIIKGDYDNVTFTSKNLSKIKELPDDFVEKQMRRYAPETPKNKISRDEAIAFLGNKYKEFAFAYYVEQDDQKADEIWKEKISYYVKEAQAQVKIIKTNPWSYLNPGNKLFSQNHPLNISPRQWYREYYQPFIIGLTNDRFEIVLRCLASLPNDIVNIICEYWLQSEVIMAKNRLLGY